MQPRRIVCQPEIIPFTDYESCPKGTLLFGGNPNYQRKISQKHEHIKIIKVTQHFNSGIINKNTPMIIINTAYIGHAIIEKIQKKVKNLNTKVTYVKHN